jgi:hypothetical protein
MSSKPTIEANRKIYQSKGISTWRELYLQFLEPLPIDSILEVGAGSPDFLCAAQTQTKIALEGRVEIRDFFEKENILFHSVDLDNNNWPQIPPVDAAVCSDVFEHLQNLKKKVESSL